MTNVKTLPKPTKRNSAVIGGQLWHFKASRFWTSDRLGGSYAKFVLATRYADGRTVQGESRESLTKCIGERIEKGIY